MKLNFEAMNTAQNLVLTAGENVRKHVIVSEL